MVSISLPLLALLPLAFTAPTTTVTSATSTTTTTCPTAGFPTDFAPYFSLKTNTFNKPASPKNNLFLSGYHVEAGTSVAVLYSEEELGSNVADLAYLNGTSLQFTTQLLESIYWYLIFGDDYDEVATPMMITAIIDSSSGYSLDSTKGLIYNNTFPQFINWLACDWFGTAGTVQLIPQFAFYWEGGDVAGLGSDGVLPANCEAVDLIPEFVTC